MNAVALLKYGQQTVLQTLEGFPESAVETPGACGVWSVKDILAHLASYAHELRNEVVEELISNLMNESCAEREAPRVGGGRNRGMESQKGRR